MGRRRGIAGALAAVLAGIALLSFTGPAGAVEPEERLSDPALETRAREISRELRCLVCQNESIDESNADLAKDLRLLVRERLTAGDTNEEVKDFIVERYGAYVLLRPPFKAETALLWAGPFTLLLLAVIALVLTARARVRHGAPEPAGLTEEEVRRLEAIVAAPEGRDGREETADGPRNNAKT
ncbi:MAG: cytochrome c-type biogenesis protein [Pseudomonadota bacterium]